MGLKANYVVRLNSSVNRIQHSGTEVKIGVNDKVLEIYDAVTVTAPLGVIKKS